MSTAGLLRSMKAKLGGGQAKSKSGNSSSNDKASSHAVANADSKSGDRSFSSGSENVATSAVEPVPLADRSVRGGTASRAAMLRAYEGKVFAWKTMLSTIPPMSFLCIFFV